MFLFVWIPRKQFKILEDKMSQFLDEFRAALTLVKVGNATDPAVTEAISTINAKLTANEATDAEQSTAIMELVTALANSTPVAGQPVEPTPAPVEEPAQ